MNRYLLAVSTLWLMGWCAPASAECLARTYKDADGLDRPLVIAVPPGEASEYGRLGFQPASCASIDLVAYRDEVCRLPTLGNSAVQNRLEEVLGAAPLKMCASAKIAAETPVPVTREGE